MNKKPISYLQTDPRWKSKDYSAKGESVKRTIGSSGCGPTCAAMLISTLTGKAFTPADACAWSLKRGYKAPNQGTYYSYFKPQFKAHGIRCEQLNGSNVYGKPSSSVHEKAFDLLKKGYYLIAVMGKGLWASSGHFVVVWWADDKVRILDPNSTKETRLNGDLSTFKSQVKYYWAIDARDYNTKKEEDEIVSYEQFKEYMAKYEAEKNAEKATWEKSVMQEAKQAGMMDGTRPKANITRGEVAQVLKNAKLI